MAERSKFQFRMRDLLWAVSLFGVAIGLGSTLWRGIPWSSRILPGAIMVIAQQFPALEQNSQNHWL